MITISSRLFVSAFALGVGALAMVPQAQGQPSSPMSEALKAVAAGKDPMPGEREVLCEMGRRGRFAGAALEVDNRDDLQLLSRLAARHIFLGI